MNSNESCAIPTNRDAAPSRLDALTGLRFAAAAVVVLSHSHSSFGIQLRWYDLINGMNLGGMGVSFFFILSGFILTHVYPSLKSNGERGRFLLARFARIWPAHVFGNLLMIVVIGGALWPAPEGYTRWGTLFRTLALLNCWVPARAVLDAYDAPTWSIAAEFFFYLCFIFLICNWQRTWWWKLLLTLAVPVGVIVVASFLGLCDGTPWSEPNYRTFLYYNPLARVYQFCLGMATALAWRKYRDRLPSNLLWATCLEVVVAAVVIVSGYYSIDVTAAVSERFALKTYGFREFTHGCSCLQALPFAALILVFANGAGLLSKFFSMRALILLGEISYAVYILHFPILDFYRRHLNLFGLWPGWESYIIFWALLLLLSHWLWVGIERPARRGIVGLLPAKQSGAITGPTGTDRAFGLGTMVRRLGAFLTPRKIVVIETAVVLLAMTAIGIHAARASFHLISPDQATAPKASGSPVLENIRFGDCYLLRSVAVMPADGGYQVRMIWECLRPESDWFYPIVHFKNNQGAVFLSFERAHKFPGGRVSPGQVWKQRIYVPKGIGDDSDQIVLALMMPGGAGEYPISGGPVDESARLIIVPQWTKLK